MNCYCCSQESYSDCCEPKHKGLAKAQTAEELMRSRYSAYCTENWAYILKTYAEAQCNSLTESLLQESATDSAWLHLTIVAHSGPATPLHDANAKVEFKAFYALKRKLYLMHETSDFIVENNQWRYTTGLMHEDTGLIKAGRNDPCFCGSGKKFKQCCINRI